MTITERQNENVCCPELAIIPCESTREHCHLVCGFSKTVISNETVKNLCIGNNFRECINMKMEAS